MGLPLLHRGHSSPHLSRRLSRVHWRGAEQQSDSWSHLGTGDGAASVVRSIPWFWMGVFRYPIATECETLAFSFDRAFHLWAGSGHGTDYHLATLVGGLDARCRSGIRQCSSSAHGGGLSDLDGDGDTEELIIISDAMEFRMMNGGPTGHRHGPGPGMGGSHIGG